MFGARQVIGFVLQFSWVLFKGQGQPASFYRELIQDYSYSNHPTTETEIDFNMCFGTAPRAAAVKAIPVDEALPHRFNVSVLGLQRDRVMVQISQVDTPANWNWMELKIEWVVYFSDNTNSGWSVPVNGYVYKALFDQFPYEESSELCRNEGAWLAVYGPMREATPMSEYWSLVPDLPNNAHFWIGLKIQGNNPSAFTYIWQNWMPLSPGSKQWNENIGNHNSAKKCFAENHRNGDPNSIAIVDAGHCVKGQLEVFNILTFFNEKSNLPAISTLKVLTSELIKPIFVAPESSTHYLSGK